MKKTMIHFEPVQVCSRLEDGRLREWYSQGKLATEREAKATAVQLRKEFPGCEYAVMRVQIDEV